MSESTIGQAARSAGCSVPTVRYYEEVGLLAPANRTASGRRTYARRDIDRLVLIRRCRDFGMSIKDVSALIGVSVANGDCDEALALINNHRRALNVRVLELKALERTLATMAGRCSDTCAGGAVDRCTIFSDMVSAN